MCVHKKEDPAGIVARRIMRNVEALRGKCRPCVIATFFRTLWNGWAASARMRSMQGSDGTRGCRFGCTNCEDRVEHYLLCRRMLSVLMKVPLYSLALSISRRSMQAMLLADGGLGETEKIAIARACYAIRLDSTERILVEGKVCRFCNGVSNGSFGVQCRALTSQCGVSPSGEKKHR